MRRVGVSSCETYNSSWDSLKIEPGLESFEQTSEIANYQLSYRRVYSSVGSWLFHLFVQNFLIRVLFLVSPNWNYKFRRKTLPLAASTLKSFFHRHGIPDTILICQAEISKRSWEDSQFMNEHEHARM